MATDATNLRLIPIRNVNSGEWLHVFQRLGLGMESWRLRCQIFQTGESQYVQHYFQQLLVVPEIL